MVWSDSTLLYCCIFTRTHLWFPLTFLNCKSVSLLIQRRSWSFGEIITCSKPNQMSHILQNKQIDQKLIMENKKMTTPKNIIKFIHMLFHWSIRFSSSTSDLILLSLYLQPLMLVSRHVMNQRNNWIIIFMLHCSEIQILVEQYFSSWPYHDCCFPLLVFSLIHGYET